MSAEVPPLPSAPRARGIAGNCRQVLLFAALTVILTVATVWGDRIWLRNSETLTFAVGNADRAEARFATKLAAMLKNASSRLHLKIVTNTDNTKALAQFDRKDADLAVLATRIAPDKAGLLATAILDIGERTARITTMDGLDKLRDEPETILRSVVIGLRDGTISSDALDTFKLGYELVRDEIGMRRENLKGIPFMTTMS